MPMMLVFAQGGSYCTFSSITDYTLSRTPYRTLSRWSCKTLSRLSTAHRRFVADFTRTLCCTAQGQRKEPARFGLDQGLLNYNCLSQLHYSTNDLSSISDSFCVDLTFFHVLHRCSSEHFGFSSAGCLWRSQSEQLRVTDIVLLVSLPLFRMVRHLASVLRDSLF